MGLMPAPTANDPSIETGIRILKKKRYIPAAILSILPWIAMSDVLAEQWACGVHFESQCAYSRCSANGEKDDGNTKPVGAQFDEEGNFLICMYSGCYEGKGKVLTTTPFLSIMQEDVEWTGTNPNKTDVFIVLERNELFGMFKADTFVQPIVCRVVEQDK